MVFIILFKSVKILWEGDYLTIYDFKVKRRDGTDFNLSDLKGKEIFHAMWDEEPVRLIGLSATNLTDSLNYQISLFDNNNQIKSKEIDKLINRINKELGSNLVFKGDKLKK